MPFPLAEVLRRFETLAIAVSGGVDSVTLAAFAHAELGAQRVRALHAVSPAVPHEATARLLGLAERHGWQLTVIDAGEMDDPRYLANPVNRCFFCKQDLYGAMRRHTAWPLASGTNTDDLGEYRPGLEAARQHGVHHPFVEADMDKAAVRRLARALQLHDIAELPASPCLSSRVETGIAIAPATLHFVHAVESALRIEAPGARAVRCRVRARGIVVEIDSATLASLDESSLRRVLGPLHVSSAFADRPLAFAAYAAGSAFVHA